MSYFPYVGEPTGLKAKDGPAHVPTAVDEWAFGHGLGLDYGGAVLAASVGEARRMVAARRRKLDAALDRKLAARTDAVGDLYRRKVEIAGTTKDATTAAVTYGGGKVKLGKAYGINGARFRRVEFPDGVVLDVCTRGRKSFGRWDERLGSYYHWSPDAWGETAGAEETRAAVIKARAVELRQAKESAA